MCPRVSIWACIFTVSDPIWVGDLETEPKIDFFYHIGPNFNGLARLEVKVVGGYFKARMKLKMLN